VCPPFTFKTMCVIYIFFRKVIRYLLDEGTKHTKKHSRRRNNTQTQTEHKMSDIFLEPPEIPTGVEDMSWFSPNSLYFILFCLVFCELTHRVLLKVVPKYNEYSLRSQRNMATYVLEVVVTFVSFILSCGWGISVCTYCFVICCSCELEIIVLFAIRIFFPSVSRHCY
jgi:hypothetical protein